MLKLLHIQNYALIEKLDINFETGLNIITGETGAGKSILIDALSLILGERADTDAVRKDTEKAIVEGIFSITDNNKLKDLLTSLEIDFSDELILRREVSLKGQSRCFVNDSLVSLNAMKNIGDLLVDLHGQHEHQSLLRTETHIDFLDDYGGHHKLVDNFSEAYISLSDEINKLRELRKKESILKEKQDLYEFQKSEIDELGIESGDEESLENELKILENAEKLNELTFGLYQLLYERNNSAYEQLTLARKQFEILSQIDDNFTEGLNESKSAESIVKELASAVNIYNSKIEFNTEKLESIRNKLGQISLLKKKYGGSIESLLAYREKIGAELKLAANFEDEINKIKTSIEEKRKIASEFALKLSTKRKETTKTVSKSIVGVLTDLGIQNSKFEIKIDSKKTDDENGLVNLYNKFYETTPKGIDFVEFYISTNIGESVKPLVKVASGGEISRIMLALKTILAKTERLPLLIFDEIDIGISGRIAQAVGLSIKNLSKYHQIIAITHLPQIAGLADIHLVVEKIEDGNRSFTKMKKLNKDERIREVAKLLSGEEVTATGLKSARELIGIK